MDTSKDDEMIRQCWMQARFHPEETQYGNAGLGNHPPAAGRPEFLIHEALVLAGYVTGSWSTKTREFQVLYRWMYGK